MATDVISNLAGSLDAELEKARETLRNVDDDIKKVFGKDASELAVFGSRNRRGLPQEPTKEDYYQQQQQQHLHQSSSRVRRRDDFDRDGDEPTEKRRRSGGGDSFTSSGRLGPMVIGPRFTRPRDSVEDDEYMQFGRRLQSRVVSSGKEKSREEVLAEQRQDRSGRERNKRMFGALLGTLQRFKQDETKLKDKEDKRAQIEAKLDEAAKKEREVVKTKKQELIKERKLRLTEIKRIEVKRRRLAELEQWENKTKYLTNFIRTEAKPHVFYLPKVMNPIMECRLEKSKQYVTEMISSKRKIVLEDLEDYEQRSKRYWEGRVAGRTSNKKIDPMDEDIEEELNEIMKSEDLAGIDEVEDFTITVFTGKDSPVKSETNGTQENNLKEEKENIKEEVEVEEEEVDEADIESEESPKVNGQTKTEEAVDTKVEEEDDEEEGEMEEVISQEDSIVETEGQNLEQTRR